MWFNRGDRESEKIKIFKLKDKKQSMASKLSRMRRMKKYKGKEVTLASLRKKGIGKTAIAKGKREGFIFSSRPRKVQFV